MNREDHEGIADQLRLNTEAVLNHHLGAFGQGVDELMQDYDDRSVLLTLGETLRGRDALRQFFIDFLERASPEFWDALEIRKIAVEGEIAFIAWAARPFVSMAADTLLIRDGIIVTQTFVSVPG